MEFLPLTANLYNQTQIVNYQKLLKAGKGNLCPLFKNGKAHNNRYMLQNGELVVELTSQAKPDKSELIDFQQHYINLEEMERQREISSKITPIMEKLQSGKKLTTGEKDYLQKNNPDLYAVYSRIEIERDNYKNEIRNKKTKKEAAEYHSQKVLAQFANITKENVSPMFWTVQAFEDEYKNYT